MSEEGSDQAARRFINTAIGKVGGWSLASFREDDDDDGADQNEDPSSSVILLLSACGDRNAQHLIFNLKKESKRRRRGLDMSLFLLGDVRGRSHKPASGLGTNAGVKAR